MRLISCSNETITVLKGIHSLLPDLEEGIGFFKLYFPHFCFYVYPSSTNHGIFLYGILLHCLFSPSFCMLLVPDAKKVTVHRTWKLCTRSSFKKRKHKYNINISSAKHLNALYLIRDWGTAMCLGEMGKGNKISQLDVNSTLSLYIHWDLCPYPTQEWIQWLPELLTSLHFQQNLRKEQDNKNNTYSPWYENCFYSCKYIIWS